MWISNQCCDGVPDPADESVPDHADGSDEKEHGELKTVENSN